MSRLIKKNSHQKYGLPPGTLVKIKGSDKKRAKITVLDYNEKKLQEKEVKKITDLFPYRDSSTVTWINIEGIPQIEDLESFGKHFHIHPLILEDISGPEQRPKIEEFDEYISIVLRMIDYDEKKGEIRSEQVSLLFGPRFVISVQTGREGDIFDPIREHIRSNIGAIRKLGTDYLTYALIDIIVDNYFILLEKIGDRIENLEENLLKNHTQKTLESIHYLKKEMIFLRKSVWPLREVISTLERTESKLIKKTSRLYLRDVYDHTIQVIDFIETFRDIISGMIDIYLSSVNNQMNSVMKVLTTITTIFIPLTLITGIYGMNFQHMPEIEKPWAYPAVLLIMLMIGVSMFIYFKKKKWI